MAVDKKRLARDGHIHPIGDAIESHPDFQDEFDAMSDEFFKKENPEYYAMLQRLKKVNGADESSIKED